MRVTVADSYGDIHNLEVNDDMDLDSFKALLATQLSQPKETILLFFNNLELRENKPLKELGIKDNDLLAFTTANNTKASLSTSDNRLSVTEQQFLNEIEALRNNLITNPRALENLKREQPELHDAVLKGPADFAAAYSKFEMHRSQLQLQKNQELAKLRDDPFNVEAQMKIESLIKEQNIMANMQNALEHNPESFAQVHMLYINTEVNGFPVKALVDSGAQSTIMNPTCAESCGILRLLDTRFAGVAMGAGTAKILGRIHSAPLKIGKEFYPCSFTVMEAKGVDLLLGLDMLKRYQASIDLKVNALIISEQKIPFLPEHEIPKAQINMDLSQAFAENSQASTSAAARPLENPQFAESSLKQLMEIGGIPRDQAIDLLKQAGGNLDLAIDMLFS